MHKPQSYVSGKRPIANALEIPQSCIKLKHIVWDIQYSESRLPSCVTAKYTSDNLRHFMPQRWICCEHQEVCAVVEVNEVAFDRISCFPYSQPVWYPRQPKYNCNGHKQRRDPTWRTMLMWIVCAGIWCRNRGKSVLCKQREVRYNEGLCPCDGKQCVRSTGNQCQ